MLNRRQRQMCIRDRLHSTSLIYQRLEQDRAARHYLELAVQAATLQSERESYQRQLEALQGRILAGS